MLCLFCFLLASFGFSHSHFHCHCRFQGYTLSIELKVTLGEFFFPEAAHLESLTVVLP